VNHDHQLAKAQEQILALKGLTDTLAQEIQAQKDLHSSYTPYDPTNHITMTSPSYKADTWGTSYDPCQQQLIGVSYQIDLNDDDNPLDGLHHRCIPTTPPLEKMPKFGGLLSQDSSKEAICLHSSRSATAARTHKVKDLPEVRPSIERVKIDHSTSSGGWNETSLEIDNQDKMLDRLAAEVNALHMRIGHSSASTWNKAMP